MSNMKFLVLACFLCVANAVFPARDFYDIKFYELPYALLEAPRKPVDKTAIYSGIEAEAPVLRSNSEVNTEGYHYFYETGNGIIGQETGFLKKVDNVDALIAQGSYQYTAPDGTSVLFTYDADENGYHPKSDRLPVGPPIPEAIQRAVEYVLAHPPKEEKNVKKF